MPENKHKNSLLIYYHILLALLALTSFFLLKFLLPAHIYSFIKSHCNPESVAFYTKFIQKNLFWLQLITTCFLFLCISGFVFSKFCISILSKFIHDFISFSKEFYHKSKTVIIEDKLHFICIILIIISGIAVRLAFIKRPIMYDESFTFLEYAKHSFINAVSNYSYPNNHIFHTILVKISYSLFGESLFAIRLPAFIFGILLIPLTYIFCRKLYGKATAIIAISIVASCGALINLSTNARGYMIICVFFLSIFLLLDNLKTHSNLFKWWLYILFSSLGFYTIPTFLYCHIILLFITFISFNKVNYFKSSFFRKIIYSQIAIAVAVFIFYLPVLLYSGIGSIISNDAVSPISYNLWFSGIAESIFSTFKGWFFNIPVPVIIILLAGFVLYFFHPETLKKLKWYLLLFFIVLLVLFIQRVIPPQRIWIFLCVPFLSMCVTGLVLLLKRFTPEIFNSKKSLLDIFAVLIALALCLNIYFNGKDEEPGFADNNRIAVWLSRNLHNEDRLIANIPIDYPLAFYLEKNNINYFQSRDTIQYSRLLIVVNSYFKQDLKQIMKEEKINSQLFSEPIIIKKFQYSTIYSISIKDTSKN